MPYVSKQRHDAKLSEFISSIEVWTAHVRDCSEKFRAELDNLTGQPPLKKEIVDLLEALQRDSLVLRSKSKKLRKA